MSGSTKPVSTSLRSIPGLIVVGMAVVGNPASAGEFKVGSLEGTYSTVLNYGIGWRVGGPDDDLLGSANGGNQNFDAGDIVINRFSGTHEIGVKKGNVDGLIRFLYYYDGANDKHDLTVRDALFGPVTGKDPNGNRPETRAVSDIQLLDAVVTVDFGQTTARVGRQLISWGESTFIGGSLNEINTVDVSNLRSPGVQLKEGLLPTNALRVQWSPTAALSFDSFYLFDFDRVMIDPAGTFWDAATFLADGGTKLGPFARGEDDEPASGGQFGINAHYLFPIGEGYDVGAYYLKTHAHAPYISIEDNNFDGRLGFGDRYRVAYPENVEMWGLSFNTLVGDAAVSGEWSHRRNLPILLNFGAGAVIPESPGKLRGFDRIEVDQVQTTVNWGFIQPRFIGADRISWLTEVAYQWVGDKPTLPTFQRVSNSSFKYQTSLTLDYNQAIGGIVNLSPKIAFGHDVHGVSPEASPIYIEGRKLITVGLDWSYLVQWTGGVSVTHSFGADHKENTNGGPAWVAKDRSWLSMNVSYQF